jgi:hypothetical protein
MKMIKRTLIAMTVVAFLVSLSHAAYIEDPFTAYNLGYGTPTGGGDYTALKVDGQYDSPIYWPFEINYKPLAVCSIPVYMQVGMYVQVDKCKDKKIILVQKNCGDLGVDADKYPCYWGCVDLSMRSNFDVKVDGDFHQSGDIITGDNWDAYCDGTDVIPGDGDWHGVTLCLKAWSAALYSATPGDEVSVGTLDVTVKPN